MENEKLEGKPQTRRQGDPPSILTEVREDKQAHSQQGDLICLVLFFFRNEESRFKIKKKRGLWDYLAVCPSVFPSLFSVCLSSVCPACLHILANFFSLSVLFVSYQRKEAISSQNLLSHSMLDMTLIHYTLVRWMGQRIFNFTAFCFVRYREELRGSRRHNPVAHVRQCQLYVSCPVEGFIRRVIVCLCTQFMTLPTLFTEHWDPRGNASDLQFRALRISAGTLTARIVTHVRP